MFKISFCEKNLSDLANYQMTIAYISTNHVALEAVLYELFSWLLDLFKYINKPPSAWSLLLRKTEKS